MNRFLLITVTLLGMLLAALLVRDATSARAAGALVVRVGDTVTVDGGNVGCKVVREGQGAGLDCRRAGKLAGSYGTMLDGDRARVVHFRSSRTAKVVFTAKHRGSARRCETKGETRG